MKVTIEQNSLFFTEVANLTIDESATWKQVLEAVLPHLLRNYTLTRKNLAEYIEDECDMVFYEKPEL